MSQILHDEIKIIIQNMCANCMEVEMCVDDEIAKEEAIPFLELFMKFRDQPDLFKCTRGGK